MNITWYGHAAFLIETLGKRIILDPYTSPAVGSYEPINETADLVVVTHENETYHSGLSQIVPPFEVVRGLEIPSEGTEGAGIRFFAIPVFETPDKRPGDEVSIIFFESEGMKVVYLGDLGHCLTAEEVKPIQNPDLLLVPAGGPPTIDYPTLPSLIELIRPRVMIPMHYLTPKINLKIQPVERFLESLPGWRVERSLGASITLDRASSVPERIIQLESAR